MGKSELNISSKKFVGEISNNQRNDLFGSDIYKILGITFIINVKNITME